MKKDNVVISNLDSFVIPLFCYTCKMKRIYETTNTIGFHLLIASLAFNPTILIPFVWCERCFTYTLVLLPTTCMTELLTTACPFTYNLYDWTPNSPVHNLSKFLVQLEPQSLIMFPTNDLPSSLEKFNSPW